MIVRLWHGVTPLSKAADYLKLMREVALPDYRSTPGNRGAYVLQRVEGDLAHFQMLTFWDDIEAVKAFAGEEYEVAKYYDFDSEMLLELEPKAAIYSAYGD